jgi:pilus assembly protein CpaE
VTSVLLISRSSEYERRLRDILGSALRSVISGAHHDDLGELVERTAEGATPDVVLLGPFLPDGHASRLAQEVRGRYPQAKVALVHEGGDEGAALADEVGADSVISPTAEAQDLEALFAPRVQEAPAGWTPLGTPVPAVPLSAMAELPPPSDAARTGRVLGVVSPKGGQGKTTIATNLAVALARVAPDSVVLVDADMQFGDIANALDLDPAHTLPDMVNGVAPHDPMVLKTLLTPHAEGFYVICGATSPIEGDKVTGDQLGHLITQLAAVFKYVVIDTTPGLGEHTLTVLDHATDAVMVTGLAVPNLRAMRTEVKVLESIGVVPPQRHLILNMADERAGMRVRDAESILEIPVDVAVPRSTAVPLASNRGVPLVVDAPRDAATKAIFEIVPRIANGVDAKSLRTSRGRKAVA